MSEEAIKDQEIQDVSDVENQDQEQSEQQPERNLTPREEKLAALQEKHNQDSKRFEAPDLEEQYGETAAGDEPEQQKPESPVYLNDKGEYVMKLKVNGVEVERSLEQIRATAQKDMAGDQKLQQAAERERQLSEYHAALEAERQRLEQITNTQLSEQDAGETADAEDVKALVAQHREYLYDGDTEKADEIMMQLISVGRQQPTLDVDGVINQAVQRSLQEQQRMTQQAEQERLQAEYNASLQRGGKWARENYGELLADPDMYRLVDGKTDEIAKNNPDLTPEEVIKQATEQVAKRFGNAKEPAPNTREANKQSLPVQPKRLANSRHTPPAKRQIDMSPAGAIAREKERRAAIQNRPVNNK
ncbi:MAG: hypothetical protein RQ714_06580 [Nitrosomonas sp.]|nr:hypothetical protein [Nitrosomonas sp.]